jgi:RING-like zinc finger
MVALLFLSRNNSPVKASIGEAWPVEIVIGGSLDLYGKAYPGRVADFGNQDGDRLFLENLNLLLPPFNQSHLCEYPPEAWAAAKVNNSNKESDDGTINVVQGSTRDNMLAALLVSYGECHPSQKVRVAAELQRNYTRYGKVTHLVIYNNNVENLDELHTLTTFVNETDFQDINVIFVSTQSGSDILESIQSEESRQRIASPFLFEDGNEFWYYAVSFREHQNDAADSAFGGGGGGSNFNHNDNHYGTDSSYPYQRGEYYGPPESDDFYWFRLLVFCMLVVSPCFRAGYLWYAGGGRIRLRYNEDGRVVGLQYIPPMPYWFGPRPEGDSYAPPTNRMTEEDVMALPVVVFNAALVDQSTSYYRDNLEQAQPQEQSQPQQQRQSELLDEDMNKDSASRGASPTNATDLEQAGGDAKATEDEPAPPRQSTCSICIDDFEDGERLRMLPRCRHIFHTDCILPWLTERQGCCPLCKTEVMEQEPGEGSTRLGETGVRPPSPAQMQNDTDAPSNENMITSTEPEPAITNGADTLCTTCSNSNSNSNTTEEPNFQSSESADEVNEIFDDSSLRKHVDDDVDIDIDVEACRSNEEEQLQLPASSAHVITGSILSSVGTITNTEVAHDFQDEPDIVVPGKVHLESQSNTL